MKKKKTTIVAAEIKNHLVPFSTTCSGFVSARASSFLNQLRSTAYHFGFAAMPESTKKTNRDRVTKTAVKSEIKTPKIRVVAKPLTGPVPKLTRTKLVRIVQAFESMIAGKARRKPSSIEL